MEGEEADQGLPELNGDGVAEEEEGGGEAVLSVGVGDNGDGLLSRKISSLPPTNIPPPAFPSKRGVQHTRNTREVTPQHTNRSVNALINSGGGG